MKRMLLPVLAAACFATACSNSGSGDSEPRGGSHWEGAFTNGMKETYISFDISEDGTELRNLTFKGYWRCNGVLEQTTIGPEKSFPVKDGKSDGILIEPEDGPAPFRYELHASFDGDKSEGTLRISNVPAGCDTYKLEFTAEPR